jgi:DNA-binding response OmpR family regulator
MRLLVVEDEPQLGELLVKNLATDSFTIDLAVNLEDAAAYLDTTRYALMLLDLNLPDGNGLDLLKSKQRPQQFPPVIVLTASGAVQDRIKGLNAGADDYLSKPFVHEELIARIGAILRRPGNALGVTLECGNIELDTVGRIVTICGTDLQLPRRELLILELLMRAAKRVVTKEAMAEAIYDYGDEPLSNALEANISRLRSRLKDFDTKTEIQSVRGIGYILRPLANNL